MSWPTKFHRLNIKSLALLLKKFQFNYNALSIRKWSRKVPVQTTRMVQEEMVLQSSRYQRLKPSKRIQRKEGKSKFAVTYPEEVVRKVPVQTVRYVTEEKIEQTPVQVCKMVSGTKRRSFARLGWSRKRTPITADPTAFHEPEVYKIPLDACGNPLTTVSSSDSGTSVSASKPAVEEPTLLQVLAKKETSHEVKNRLPKRAKCLAQLE